MSSHGLSVIIPVRGRRSQLQRLIDSLCRAQSRLAATRQWNSEIIVVDDTPVRMDGELIKSMCARSGVRYVRGPREVAAKRNLGAQLASYDLFVFVDSDCVADEELLVTHAQAHLTSLARSGRPLGAVAGAIDFDDDGAASEPPEGSDLLDAPFAWPRRFVEVYWAATANFSVSREAFEMVDGFDDYPFTPVGGEDADIGMRLYDAGYAIVCEPSARVFHEAQSRQSSVHMCAKMYMYGRACIYNNVRRPGESKLVVNMPAVAALAGVCFAGRRRRTGLGLTTGLLAYVIASAAKRRSHGSKATGPQYLEFFYQAGMASEAIRRKKPWLAFCMFDYGNRDRFLTRAVMSDTTHAEHSCLTIRHSSVNG